MQGRLPLQKLVSPNLKYEVLVMIEVCKDTLLVSLVPRSFFVYTLVMRFAEYLLQNYGTDPEVTWILDCE